MLGWTSVRTPSGTASRSLRSTDPIASSTRYTAPPAGIGEATVVETLEHFPSEAPACRRLPLAEAADAYSTFQAERDGAVKILFEP